MEAMTDNKEGDDGNEEKETRKTRTKSGWTHETNITAVILMRKE